MRTCLSIWSCHKYWVGNDVSGESVCISVSGRHYKGTISGEGGVDFKFIFSTLKNNGYKGWLSVEFEGVEEQQSGSIRSVENIVNIVKNL